jgi:EAL domain-containing protein (putative c-di-GMP-specific phosphodiesterase class I)
MRPARIDRQPGDEAQARQLRQLRCDTMLGYLFSRPLACNVFEARYLRHA